MEYITFIIFVAVILLLMTLMGKKEERRRKLRFRQELEKRFGTMSQKEISPERYAHIGGYYEKHRQDTDIDAITWNDLEMDQIYSRMDTCQSAAGEEYLYALLHAPALNKQQEQLSEEQLSYLTAHAKERVQLQEQLAELGGTGKYSLYDHLDYLDQLGERKPFKHMVSLLLPLVCVALMFVSVSVGTVALVLALGYNLYSYFNEKRQIEPYLVSFGFLLRLIRCAKAMTETDAFAQEEIFAEEKKSLSQLTEGFRDFCRGSGLLLSGSYGAGGSPADLAMDYVRMLLHLDLLKFDSMLAQVKQKRKEIDLLLTVIGRMDAQIAVASYRQALPYWSLPILEPTDGKMSDGKEAEGKVTDGKATDVDGKLTDEVGQPSLQLSAQLASQSSSQPFFHVQELYHPLIAEPVPNSLDTERSVLLTGSNASGKSTFLKAVALCALLSQTIRTAPAKAYKGNFFRIYSSMALRDNLQGGESYFIVEIKSLKRIVDAVGADGDRTEQACTSPILCFIDEVLRGTNTVERIAASAQILKSLSEKGALCFAATHDVELTHMLEEFYENYHFEESFAQGDISFPYRLLQGRAQSRNAIRLLSSIGYEPEVVQLAEESAQRFLDTGNWCL